MNKKYNWKSSFQTFERTYRKISNLDDRYENGIHDLMKYIKFGYGRASDHASKDIRTGYLSRNKGIEYVKKYDHVVSSDLDYWLDYVNMKEEDFGKLQTHLEIKEFGKKLKVSGLRKFMGLKKDLKKFF